MPVNAKEKLEAAVFDSIGAMMQAYAEEAVRIAWSDHRKRLDWSDSSIAVLDALLEGQSADDPEFQTRLWGGYFGEVLRRQFGGEWSLTQYPGGVAAVPTLEVQGSRLYPLMKVYRRLTMGAGEDLLSFYRMAAARLRVKPKM